MERLNVIEKVQEATEWVNSMVVITKPNGKLRICIDPRDLNKVIKREYYPMRMIEEIAAHMPNAKFFSVLDASSGYWQVQLVPNCVHSIRHLADINSNACHLDCHQPLMCSKK